MDENLMSVLKKFYYNTSLKFNQIKEEEPSNKLAYWLKKLVGEGYLENSDGLYKLTTKGEIFISYLDTGNILRQPITDVMLFPVKGKKILWQRRKKVPFKGILGPICSKMAKGTGIFDTCQEKLLKNTGYSGKIEFKGIIEGKTIMNGEVYLHHFLNVFKITDLKGDFIESTDKADNFWYTLEEYEKQDNFMTGMKEHLEVVNSAKFTYIEINQYLDSDGAFLRSEVVRRA